MHHETSQARGEWREPSAGLLVQLVGDALQNLAEQLWVRFRAGAAFYDQRGPIGTRAPQGTAVNCHQPPLQPPSPHACMHCGLCRLNKKWYNV
jgi:hypothetical protein